MKIIIVCLATLLVPMFSTTTLGQECKGYLKKDVESEDIGIKVYKGEELTDGTRNNNQCCFETAFDDDLCIDFTNLSSKKIPRVDLSLTDVKYVDDEMAVSNVCKEGKPIADLSDAYKWSYAFKAKSTEPIDESIIVEASHTLLINGNVLNTVSMNKTWIGRPDGNCHSIKFEKKDIDKFIKEYLKFSDHIDVEQDLSVEVQFSMKLFSKRPEENYKNNKTEFKTILPSDNPTSWPPKDI